MFANEESLKESAENRGRLSAMFGNRLRFIRLRKRDPLFTADVLRREIEAIDIDQMICIDISTFTREALLLIIRIIDELDLYRRVHFFYSRAQAYSVGSEPGKEWLSRGVSTVRSVLGYPGDLLPGRPLHLIILPGVEFDRAMRLCEEFTPNHISIGIGHGDREVDKEFKRKVETVSDKMKQFHASCSIFSFSTVDAVKTADDLWKLETSLEGFNVIVAPMSNKISTVGAALSGLVNKEIQLTYAEPIEYNLSNYSVPDDTFVYFALTKGKESRFEHAR
jgi:hypothetical protein